MLTWRLILKGYMSLSIYLFPVYICFQGANYIQIIVYNCQLSIMFKGQQLPTQTADNIIHHDQFFYCEMGFLTDLPLALSSKDKDEQGRWGRTCLICASMANQLETVQYLLRIGANPTIRCDYGWTAFDWAVRLRHPHIVQRLINAELPVQNYPFPNCHPSNIFDAAQTDDPQTMIGLIKAKPKSVKAKGVFNRTPLHWAAIVGSDRCWDILIKYGCSPHEKDSFGRTPLDYIQNNKLNKLHTILKITPQIDHFLDFKIIFDVVIIGAGAAGIAAARYLRDNTHKSYVVLEARNRIGGRVYSEKVGDKEQDFGASWIHNFSTENPFKKLVEGLDWPQIHYDVNNTEWFDLNGKYNPEIHKQASKLFQQMVKKGRSKVGSSVWQSIKGDYSAKIEPGSDLERYFNYCRSNVQCYEACFLEDLDVGYDVYDELHGYNFSPNESYFKLLERLASGLNIRTGKKVFRIDYRENIAIYLENEEVYRARKCIITLPLGVLKTDCIQFVLLLPKTHQVAIKNLGFGIMNKIFLQYDKKFWKGQIKIISELNGEMSRMIDRSTKNSHILMVFITADYAKTLTGKSEAQILGCADEILSKVYGNRKSGKLIGGRVTKWELDPFSRGSYSHFGPGSSHKDCETLGIPINNQLYFAGEHLYGRHIGTVYGAFITGERAGRLTLQNDIQK